MAEAGTRNPIAGRPGRIRAALAILALAALVGIVAPLRTSLPTLGLFLVPFASFTVLGALLAFYWPRADGADTAERPILWLILVTTTAVAAAGALLTVEPGASEKPFAFYVAYGIAVLALALQCAVAPRSGGAVAAAVVQSAALVFLFAATTHNLVPYAFGADATFHRRGIEGLVLSGTSDAIAQPYNRFASFHYTAGFGALLGVDTREAILFGNAVVVLALAIATALLVRRAHGPRAAILAVALLAAMPGPLATASSLSPSKAGVWVVVASAFFLLTRSATGAAIGIALAFVALLYHPSLGAAALLFAAGYLVVAHGVRGRSWLTRVGAALGFEPGPARFLSTRQITSAASIGLVAVAFVAWFLFQTPRVLPALAAPFLLEGSQAGAVGVVRVASVSYRLIGETLLVNVAATVLLAPAVFASVRATLAPRNLHQFYLAVMLLSVAAFIAAITATGLFLVGPERFLAILDVLVVASAAPAIVLLLSSRRTGTRLATAVFLSFVILASASSYRVDGNSHLSAEVPKQTDWLTEQTVAMTLTLRPLLQRTDTLVLDGYVSFHAANFPSHTQETFWANPVPRTSILPLEDRGAVRSAVFVWSETAADRSLERARMEEQTLSWSRLYDNGDIVAGVT